MERPDEAQQPAQVPGDAESPPKGESDQTAERANRHTDPTEPVQSERRKTGGKLS